MTRLGGATVTRTQATATDGPETGARDGRDGTPQIPAAGPAPFPANGDVADDHPSATVPDTLRASETPCRTRQLGDPRAVLECARNGVLSQPRGRTDQGPVRCRTLDGREYERLIVGKAGVTRARMQVKVTKPSDITYEVRGGGVAVDFPKRRF